MIKCFSVILFASNFLYGHEIDYNDTFDVSIHLIKIQNLYDESARNETVIGHAYGCYASDIDKRKVVIFNMRDSELQKLLSEDYFE